MAPLRAAMCKNSFRATYNQPTRFSSNAVAGFSLSTVGERTDPISDSENWRKAISRWDFEESQPLRTVISGCDAGLFPVQLSLITSPTTQFEKLF